jgi:isoquinoline 1-oxidoreductase beta subunit
MTAQIAPGIALNRRQFLVTGLAAGAGLSFGFATRAALPTQPSPEINAWVLIKPDDTVVIRIARSEMGQGSLTGLAQLVAEELDCDWSKVTTEYPTPGQSAARNRAWGSFSTGGSQGIRGSHLYVRQGGAAAREMLVRAAAEVWKVAPGDCSVAKGVITHTPSGRKTSFGKVAARASKLEPPKEVTLKPVTDWVIAGKSLKRLDTLDKLTGKQIYGIDVTLPGMKTAAIRACPVRGGRLKSYAADKIQTMPGVLRVLAVDDTAVAVVAETFWQAKIALDALQIEWDEGPSASVTSASIDAMVKEGLDSPDAFVGNKAGDAASALKQAAKTVESVYRFPFQNHATMEPMNATARWTPERCEVWAPTQNGEAAFAATVEAAGLPAGQCDVYKMLLGGGFGRRGQSDYVRQAVLIAKQMPGIPVKLLWTREEDMTQGYYHPFTQCKLTGGLDKDGKLIALKMRISGQSILAKLRPQALQDGKDPAVFQGLNPDGEEGVFAYQVPNLLIDHAMRNTHLMPGFWRGVNINQNAVYLECFIDELAHAAGQDPLDFRRALLKPKQLAVLNAVAEKANYGKTERGVFQGLAQIMAFGSYVAACADISVGPGGKLKVHRIVAGTDPGTAVNPAQIERQVAGSFVYGLSAMLYGECTVKDGAVVETNFDSYNVVRINEMPKVETILMPSGGFWGGVGEPTIAVAAPAVLNGIFAATGTRVRSLPIKDQNLLST